jgi:hypothetical protein
LHEILFSGKLRLAIVPFYLIGDVKWLNLVARTIKVRGKQQIKHNAKIVELESVIAVLKTAKPS